MSDFAIRAATRADEPFIYKAWLRGYWDHFPARAIVSESEFFERWHRVIERILADKRTITVVAHVEGEPDSLLGFACANSDCVHWAYVKQAFRKLGIAHAMLNRIVFKGSRGRETPCGWPAISHWPGPVDGWTYAPQLLREYAE